MSAKFIAKVKSIWKIRFRLFGRAGFVKEKKNSNKHENDLSKCETIDLLAPFLLIPNQTHKKNITFHIKHRKNVETI